MGDVSVMFTRRRSVLWVMLAVSYRRKMRIYPRRYAYKETHY